MLRLISLLVLAFLAYLALKAAMEFIRIFSRRGRPSRGTERLGGEMAEDPNCHTYIPKATAVQRKVSGQVYYFCSQECADAFSRK